MVEGWSKRVEAARTRLEALRALPAPERAVEAAAVEALFVGLAREAAGLDADAVVRFEPSISGASYDAHGALRVGAQALDPARPRLRGLIARTGPVSQLEPAALAGDLAAWALALERGAFEPREGRALVEAAARLVDGLPVRADAEALSALAALAAVERALPSGALRGELRHVVRAAVAARLGQLEGQGERPGAARLALAIALCFEGTGLLPPASVELQVATLMGEAPEPEPRGDALAGAEIARLEEALGDVARAVADGDVGEAAAAAQALAEASAAAGQATPQMARAVLRLGFARAAARVVDPASLRRFSEAFRPVLGGEALSGTPLADVLRAWADSRDVAAPREGTGDPVVDTLAERLFRRGDAYDAAAPLARRPALAEALLAGIERRLNRFSIGSRAMDGALRLGLFAEDKLTRFDRRFRTLEALITAAEELGDVGLFAHFDAFAALELGGAELVLPTIGTDGDSLAGGFSDFGGFGGGFGGLGGLGGGVPGLDPKALAALAALASSGEALRGLGGLGGRLSPQMLQAMARMAGKGPGALASMMGAGAGGLGTLLRQAGALRALSSSFSGGARPGAFGGGAFRPGSSSALFGAGHLALGFTGGGGVGGLRPGFAAPGGPRGAMLLPALARQSVSLPRGPGLAGFGGAMFSGALPGGFGGAFASGAFAGPRGAASWSGGSPSGGASLPSTSGPLGSSLRLPSFAFGGGLGGGSGAPSSAWPAGLGSSPRLRGGATGSWSRLPDWFGAPTRGALHDFALDGFGRPRLSAGPGAGAWLGAFSGASRGGGGWPSAGAWRGAGGSFGALGASGPSRVPSAPFGASFTGPAGGFSYGALPGGRLGASRGRAVAFAGGGASWFSGARPFGAAFPMGSFGAGSFGAGSFGPGSFGSGSFGSGSFGPGSFGAARPFGRGPGAPSLGAAGRWSTSPGLFGAPFFGSPTGSFSPRLGAAGSSSSPSSFPSAGSGGFFGGWSQLSMPGGLRGSPFRGLPPAFAALFGAPRSSGSSWAGAGSLPAWPPSWGLGRSPFAGASFGGASFGGASFGGASFGGAFAGSFTSLPSSGGLPGSWRPRGVALPRGGVSTGGSGWSGASAWPTFGAARPTALGLDLGVFGAGRVPLFPGAGLSWRAMSAAGAPASTLRGVRAATMPATASGWRGAFGGLGGAFAAPSFGPSGWSGSGSLGAGAFSLPSGAFGSPAGFLAPGGSGLPVGFTRGLTSGMSGFGASFRAALGGAGPGFRPTGRASAAALMPALGDVGLHAASSLPLVGSPAFGAPSIGAPSADARLGGPGGGTRGAPVVGIAPLGLDVPFRLPAARAGLGAWRGGAPTGLRQLESGRAPARARVGQVGARGVPAQAAARLPAVSGAPTSGVPSGAGASSFGAFEAPLLDAPALRGGSRASVAVALPRGGWAAGAAPRRGRLPAFGAAGFTMPADLPGWDAPLDGLVDGRGLIRAGRLVGASASEPRTSSSPAPTPRLASRLQGGGIDPAVLEGLARAGLVSPGAFGWPPAGAVDGAATGPRARPAAGLHGAGRERVGGLDLTGLVPSGGAGAGRAPLAALGGLFDLGQETTEASPLGAAARLADAPAAPLDLRAGAMELPRVAVPFPAAMPGADLARHLMGLPVQGGGGGAMQLGRYDGVAWSRAGDAGLLRPGGWRGLAAHDLARPAVGLREASSLAAGKLPRRLQARSGSLARAGRPRSALDLAGLTGSPRLVPAVADRADRPELPAGAMALAAAGGGPRAVAAGGAVRAPQVVGGRSVPPRAVPGSRPAVATPGSSSSSASSSGRPGPRASRAAARPVTPDLGAVRPRVTPGWQALAAEQLDGHEPVFAYGAGAEPATLRPLASRAELVTPAATGRVETPWGSVPLGVTRAGSDGAALGGALRPQPARGDRGLLQQALVGRGLPPRLASRAASLAGPRAGRAASLALPLRPGASPGLAGNPAAAGGRVAGGASWSSLLGAAAGGADLLGATGRGDLVGADARRPVARAGSRPATSAPATAGAPAPEQVLLGGSRPSAVAATGPGRALDPALLGLLGQGPRARGASGLGWLGGPTTRRMVTPVGRDVAGALPLPLREFVRGGAAPTAAVRLVTAPDATTVAPPSSAGAAPAAPALERDDELVRPVAPVQVVASPPAARTPSSTPASPALPVGAPTQPAVARPAARRAAAPRSSSSSPRQRVDMEHTNLVAGVAGGGVLRSSLDAADAEPGGDKGEVGASRESSSTEAAVPAQQADLSLLVNQIYAQLKRELMIERERKG